MSFCMLFFHFILFSFLIYQDRPKSHPNPTSKISILKIKLLLNQSPEIELFTKESKQSTYLLSTIHDKAIK